MNSEQLLSVSHAYPCDRVVDGELTLTAAT